MGRSSSACGRQARIARPPSPDRKLRCAIYTRKSSEEGLDQDFNSLHAQREACEAYIKSQAGEGWGCLKTAYDDGGISGGTMEREGLKRLLADVAEGLVDVVVVYKVDRLTRSLHDFARIVEVFDGKGVSFVSVTQAFNTTTSMGRLTLNVLLSFAQFEREVTGERIRDKLAQSKAKGMWMGGSPPLGYQPDGRTLKIIPEEAELVRHIFRSYLTAGTVYRLAEQLRREGRTSKAWTTSKGRAMGGKTLHTGAINHLLRNALYIGKIPHKDLLHQGTHAAIIDMELWDAVQAHRSGQVHARRTKSEVRLTKAPLMGLIFDADGVVMSPTKSFNKAKAEYRYYVSTTLQKGGKVRAQSGIHRLPAEAMEGWVQALMKRVFPSLQEPFRPLARVDVLSAAVDLTIEVAAFGNSGPEQRSCIEQARTHLRSTEALVEGDRKGTLRLHIPHRLTFRGGRSWTTGQDHYSATSMLDTSLIDGLRKAHTMVRPTGRWNTVWMDEAPVGPHEKRMARLAFLAPELQRDILSGRQPQAMTLETLKSLALPLCWADQVKALSAIGR